MPEIVKAEAWRGLVLKVVREPAGQHFAGHSVTTGVPMSAIRTDGSAEAVFLSEDGGGNIYEVRDALSLQDLQPVRITTVSSESYERN